MLDRACPVIRLLDSGASSSISTIPFLRKSKLGLRDDSHSQHACRRKFVEVMKGEVKCRSASKVWVWTAPDRSGRQTESASLSTQEEHSVRIAPHDTFSTERKPWIWTHGDCMKRYIVPGQNYERMEMDELNRHRPSDLQE